MLPRQPQEIKDDSSRITRSTKNERRISVVVPSKVKLLSLNDMNSDDVEETEIAAQITLPQEGGWGWVVVACSFTCIFLVDGIAFTFGSIFSSIKEEFKMDDSLISLINSIAVALYFCSGPFTSALINRFGFRAITMTGAIIVSSALFCSVMSQSYVALCIFYGGFAGVGYCFINMSAFLIVGFYFEKLRALALGIASAGSSLGIMALYPLNFYVVNLTGWRTLTLLHSGLIGILYFLGMTFRPLATVTINVTTNEPIQTVTYLPNISAQKVKPIPSQQRASIIQPNVTEKIFNAASNYNFPTAAAVVKEGIMNTNNQVEIPGPSTQVQPLFTSRLTLTAHATDGGINPQHQKQLESILSRMSTKDLTKKQVQITLKIDEQKKKLRCWEKICTWEKHISQSRPMYRDDAFFAGKIETLPAYKKSVADISSEHKTGLEYQLAVSRAITTADLVEKKGVCTTAARRILATMMDPELLKKSSFLLLSTSAFFIYLGTLVPFIFVQERNRSAGIDEEHCTWFVSTIGFSNAVGRLVLGILAVKLDPLKMFITTNLIAGTATASSNLSFNVYYQYLCCSIFGFFISGITCLRSLALVKLYGLDKLTNATGLLLLFQGIASCISTPAASVVKNMYGFSYAFYFAGFFIALGGVFLIPVRTLSDREHKKNQIFANIIT